MPNTATLNIKALKAVNLFASTEAPRFYLNGVLLEVHPRHVLYVATDGHRLLCHREDLAEDAEPNTWLGKMIVPSAAIAAVKGGTGRFDNVPATMTELAENKFQLTAPKSDSVFSPIDGTFPDWHRTIPPALDKDTTTEPHQMNGHYVASFAKAAELLGYNTLAPHFHPVERGQNPVPVTFGDDKRTFGIIMPVRNAAAPWAGAPAWISTAAAEVLQAAE